MTSTFLQRLLSALLYASCSGLITIVNKLVLTSYGFPSYLFLAIGQLVISIIVLFFARAIGLIHFPSLSQRTMTNLMPLPMIFFFNLLFGLGGTQAVSLPMFTALRRFSIWMTMIGEQWLLGVRPSSIVQTSVYLMVIGALIASGDDLTFNWSGYVFLTMNNLLTAAQGVVMKRKLLDKDLNQYGLLFYNSLMSLPPMLMIAYSSNEFEKIRKFDSLLDSGFIFVFLLSSMMGFLLNYSSMLCTNYNSPLTTAVVGACKNLFVTYIGMFIGGDYIYSLVNFLGLNISVLGSLIYSWVTFTGQKSTKKVQ